LLVSLPLLASAATAQAESKWVLWHHSYAAKQWDRIRRSTAKAALDTAANGSLDTLPAKELDAIFVIAPCW
jgi:hypothetical protein